MAPAQFPTEGVVLTHLLVVSDLERSRHFYRDVLGASVYREYGGTSCVLLFQGSWLLLVTGGGPVVATWDIRSLNRPFASVRYLAFITFLGECMELPRKSRTGIPILSTRS